MSNLTNEEVEFYQDYQLATPGQSLTNPPDQKYPWEGPPQFTNRHDAELYILTQLTEEEVFLALMDMIGDGIENGGNDYPLAELMDNTEICDWYHTKGWEHTKEILESLND